MRDLSEGIIGTAPDPLAGLPLALQREATPECARPVATAQMRGAGQAARTDARERTRHTVEDAYRRIARSLEGHGPQTRKELAETCGMPVNTINARVSEMRDYWTNWTVLVRSAPDAEAQGDPWYQFGVVTHGRRNGESIVHLARLFTPSDAAPPAQGRAK